MLNKLLPKKRNKRKRQKNWKNIITAKIEVGIAHLLLNIALLPIKLTKNSMAFTKHIANLYIFLRNLILFWTKRKIR